MRGILVKACCFSLALLAIVSLQNCAKEIERDPIGLNIASPIDAAVDKSGEYFYVLNSDFTHKYSTASILISDRSGNKLSHLEVPRLGRVLTVSGDDLFAAFDGDIGQESVLMLWDISTPTAPVLKKRWDVEDCGPLNITARQKYPYFALACGSGRLYIGTLAKERSESSLSYARSYPGFVRRAMYIDPQRGLLFAFVTDLGEATLHDAIYEDRQTWTDKGEPVLLKNEANDIPDSWETSESVRRDILEKSSRFLFAVYDLTAEAADGFLFKKHSLVRHEMRWMYFNLDNVDGTPDRDLAINEKYYRTNFWEAMPDPENSAVFYLSHRGMAKAGMSENANSIIKVTIVGDPRSTKLKTENFLNFKRIYGFKGDLQNPRESYLGDFDLTRLSGKRVVVVNSFRDIVNFTPPRYSIAAATFGDEDEFPWTTTTVSTAGTGSTYFQFATGRDGHVLTCSSYDNKVILLKLTLGEEIKFLRTL